MLARLATRSKVVAPTLNSKTRMVPPLTRTTSARLPIRGMANSKRICPILKSRRACRMIWTCSSQAFLCCCLRRNRADRAARLLLGRKDVRLVLCIRSPVRAAERLELGSAARRSVSGDLVACNPAGERRAGLPPLARSPSRGQLVGARRPLFGIQRQPHDNRTPPLPRPLIQKSFGISELPHIGAAKYSHIVA